jgi:hypothetical protein
MSSLVCALAFEGSVAIKALLVGMMPSSVQGHDQDRADEKGEESCLPSGDQPQ